MIRLGDRVKDMVTGLEGVATSRTEWLNGCVRWGVEFLIGKPGTKEQEIKRESFDQEQLVVTKAAAVVPQKHDAPPVELKRRTGGGGRPEPQSR